MAPIKSQQLWLLAQDVQKTESSTFQLGRGGSWEELTSSKPLTGKLVTLTGWFLKGGKLILFQCVAPGGLTTLQWMPLHPWAHG